MALDEDAAYSHFASVAARLNQVSKTRGVIELAESSQSSVSVCSRREFTGVIYIYIKGRGLENYRQDQENRAAIARRVLYYYS